MGSVVVTLWRAEPVPAGSPANITRGDENAAKTFGDDDAQRIRVG